MGYTTDFEGSFKIDRPLDYDTYFELEDAEVRIDNHQESLYWTVQKDRQTVRDTADEKWRTYEEQLQWLSDFLRARGYHLTGKVYYSGESVTDCGTLVVNSQGKVEKYPAVFE